MYLYYDSNYVIANLSCQRNERHFAAAWFGKTSGFEVVHGLLDRIMVMLKIAFITREEGLKNDKIEGYWIEEVDGEVLYSLKCGS